LARFDIVLPLNTDIAFAREIDAQWPPITSPGIPVSYSIFCVINIGNSTDVLMCALLVK
jgi:hypothetical protein